MNWQSSLVRKTATTENIRVLGSHIGLGFNISAIYAIADRLAQPAGSWRSFRAPFLLRGLYLPADDLDPTRLPGRAA